MTKLRAGIIGAGSWATAWHIPALAARKEVELVSVCRRNPEVLSHLKSKFGFAVASENYLQALDHDLDIVVVASPTAAHFEQVMAALDRGLHVLCEKPMTLRSTEAWALVDKAKQMNVQLLLSFGWNFMPIITRAKALLDEHGIGELEHVTVHMSSQTRELLSNSGAYPDADPDTIPQQSTWTDPSLSGGGYGQAQLSHALALLFSFFPVRAVDGRSMLKSVLSAPVESHAAAIFEFDSGAIGAVSGGSSHVGAWGNKHELEIRAIGTEGQLIVDVHRELVWLYRADGTGITLDLPKGAGNYQAHGPANALVDVALGHLEANTAPGELGARTVEALEVMYNNVISRIG